MAARAHVLDTEDGAGPWEDIVVLAKTHSGPCEDKVVLAKTHSGPCKDAVVLAKTHNGACEHIVVLANDADDDSSDEVDIFSFFC